MDNEDVLANLSTAQLEQLAHEPMMQLFRYQHLPPDKQTISKMFHDLAVKLVLRLPRNPERTVCLRKLREAKDCAVTASLWFDPATKVS